MNFGWAQAAMDSGERVKREAWDSYADTHPTEYASLALVVPGDGYEEVYIATRHDGTHTMFNPSHSALRAKDWTLA